MTTSAGTVAVAGTSTTATTSVYEPLCFNSEVLQSESFSVEAFLSDCRRRVPLDAVLRDLEQYARSLDATLVELINKDYKDFVALSANLVGIAGARDELGEPLRVLWRELQTVRAGVHDAADTLERKLTERRELARKQRTLELLAALLASLARIEALLHVESTTAFGGALDVSHLRLAVGAPATAALLERLTLEFAQLAFYTVAAANLPLVRQLERRIEFAQRTMRTALEQLLRDALLAPPDRAPLADAALPLVLRGFTAIAATADAEALFCTLIVRPWLERTVTRDALDGAVRGSCQGLPALCDAVVRFVDTECRRVLAPNAPPEFDFLSRAIWPEIERVFVAELGAIFRPAIPDLFHRHYTTATAFLARIEQLCADDAHLARFRASPAHGSFERRWNLAIYFQLRFQDLRSEFEEALAASLAAAAAAATGVADEGGAPLRGTTQLCASLQRCWAADVLLRPLVPRFFKLSLQFVARYERWLRALLSAPTRPDDALLVRAFLDSERLARDLDALFARCVAGAALNDAQIEQTMLGAFRSAVATLGGVSAALADALLHDVVQRCTAELAAMKAITGAFRMTNKPAPRAASAYVARVLAPLERFLTPDSAVTGGVTASTRRQWAQSAAASTTEAFAANATELLATVQRSDGFLRRIVKRQDNQSAAAATAESLSDTEKISLQLYLDVKEYSARVRRLDDLDRNADIGLARLQDMVAEFEKFQN